MKNLTAGWVIPIAVMFIISFPPLFGHEIVAILCGVVWGLWVGFGIVAAGTMLGEVSYGRRPQAGVQATGRRLESSRACRAQHAAITDQARPATEDSERC